MKKKVIDYVSTILCVYLFIFFLIIYLFIYSIRIALIIAHDA